MRIYELYENIRIIQLESLLLYIFYTSEITGKSCANLTDLLELFSFLLSALKYLNNLTSTR